MDIKQHVSEIKKRFLERQEESRTLAHFLVSKGMAASVAEKIVRDAILDDRSIAGVKKAIAAQFNVAGELLFDRPHRLIFTGPTGVGKTTTIKKLCQYYLKKEKQVAVMSLDEAKKGELQSWAIQKGIAWAEEVSGVAADLLFIDTEGCNFYLPNRIDALGEQIGSLGEEAEVVLTLSAAAKEVDLYGAIHQFSPLCPTSLVFTKIDETLASAVMVNVSMKTDIPIRYMAYGYPLPGEVEVADSESLAHKILTDFNSEQFNFIRHLSL